MSAVTTTPAPDPQLSYKVELAHVELAHVEITDLERAIPAMQQILEEHGYAVPPCSHDLTVRFLGLLGYYIARHEMAPFEDESDWTAFNWLPLDGTHGIRLRSWSQWTMPLPHNFTIIPCANEA